MHEELNKAKNVQNAITGYLNSPASTLIRVPEIENDSPEDAIRKLQIMIFELSDSLAALARHVEANQRGSVR
jgi:hypothetical protein